MKTRFESLFFLSLLAVVFSIGLTFASIELPRLLDSVILKNIDTPDVATGLDESSDHKTELYLRAFHLRWIGYGCLALTVIMIGVGFITEKSGWASAGALVLFLPVFGHFAATMFFLGGLGFLRLLWLPLLDVSFRVFRLGEIVTWPHKILSDAWAVTGLGRWIELPAVMTGLGLLIFFLGTLTWLYARARKRSVADLGIYRLSRHPQYLGWIVWSYGIMFLPASNIKLCYELSNSLPWLLSTMIIIGIAMLEEVKMSRVAGEPYDAYRRRTPFLIPLPRFVAKASAVPLRLMFRKPYPERKREIVAVLAFYSAFVMGTSVFYGGLVPGSEASATVSPRRIEELARVLKDAGDRGKKRWAAGLLEKSGTAAFEALFALLEDKDPNVRAYAAGALGGLGSDRAVPPLVGLLKDKDSYVRKTAAGALGRTGSSLAVQPLIEALRDPLRDMAGTAAQALGQIKDPDAVPPLIDALGHPEWRAVEAAARVLGEMGAKEAIEPLIRCLEEMADCPYHAVGVALWKLGSERAADAWIAGLKKKGSWWHPQAACAAELGKHRLEEGLLPLQDALKDESPEVRRAAVLALTEFASERTSDALRGALSDKDLEVRLYAREALKKIVTVESILNGYLKALGGTKALESVRTRRLAGELTHDFPGQAPPKTIIPAEVFASADGKWRLVLRTAAGVQQMGFDGISGWLQDADRVLVDNRQARSKLAYLFSPGAALRLEDYFGGLSAEGKVVSEGREEVPLKARDTGGRDVDLYFDAQTGLLRRLGQDVVVKGYRRKAGVLHPAEITIARAGGTSTYRFFDISINLPIEDARFSIPKLGQVFPDVFKGLSDPMVVPLLKDFPSVHEDMNVPCRDGRFLHDLIIQSGYKRGLEIGSFTGYSALWLGLAFKATGGSLVTIEYEAESGEEARKNVRRAGLEAVVDARIADAFEEIPKIEGAFDFVFIDAWKPDYIKFLRLIRNRVVPGGVIVAHNVTNHAADMRDYLEAIRNDPGLETTFHELSAEGMSASIVRALKSSSDGPRR